MLVAIIAVVAGILILIPRVVRRREKWALALLAPLGMPFLMTCNVDIDSFRRFGAFAGDPTLKAAVTRCAIGTDGRTLHIAPGVHKRSGVGPQPFAVDLSQAGPAVFGRHRSNWPALIIPVQGSPEPIHLTRQSWGRSGIAQSPLAHLITGPIPA